MVSLCSKHMLQIQQAAVCIFCRYNRLPVWQPGSTSACLFPVRLTVAHAITVTCKRRRCKKVTHLFGDMKGAFSQGTIASLAQAFFMENSQERRQSSDPYCLDPPHSQSVIFFCMLSHIGLVNIVVKPVSPTDFSSLRRSSQL